MEAHLFFSHLHIVGIAGEMGGAIDAGPKTKIIGAINNLLLSKRVGHVYQNRFKSEYIEDDIFLKTVIRYIHQNPVKAGMVKRAEEYRWSSCTGYLNIAFLVKEATLLSNLDYKVAFILFIILLQSPGWYGQIPAGFLNAIKRAFRHHNHSNTGGLFRPLVFSI